MLSEARFLGRHRMRTPTRYTGASPRSAFGIDEGVGELAVLHKFADMAIKGGTNRPELGEMNVSPAGLDPVIGQARHAEDAGRSFLREPQHAASAPQGGSNASLCILRATRWLLL